MQFLTAVAFFVTVVLNCSSLSDI